MEGRLIAPNMSNLALSVEAVVVINHCSYIGCQRGLGRVV